MLPTPHRVATGELLISVLLRWCPFFPEVPEAAMNDLLQRYKRSAFHQYFEGLEPIDLITFWAIAALVFVLGFAINAIGRAP